jgi:hypothetical protein
MNKLLIIVLLLTGALCQAQDKNYLSLIKNDWEKYELKGKVKRVVRREYVNGFNNMVIDAEFNERGFLISKVATELNATDTSKQFVIVSTVTYDTIKNSTRITETVQGVKSEEDTYEYDATGKLLKINYTSFTEGSRLLKIAPKVTTTKYSYDEKNRLLQEMNFAGTALINTISWEYLPDGNKRSTYRDGKKMQKNTEVTECDTLKVAKTFEADEKPESIWVYRKDAHGNIFYSEGREINGKLISHTNFYFDQYNSVVKSVNYWTATKKTRTSYSEYTYAEVGNITSMNDSWDREITYW